MRKDQTDNIRPFLAKAIDEGRKDVINLAVSEFSISRQAVNKHVAGMVAEGILKASGRTRGRAYALRTLAQKTTSSLIPQHPAEHEIWQEHFAGMVLNLPENVRNICSHGFSEMFNNAMDHSEGQKVTTSLALTYAAVTIHVDDDGIGIFTKIKNGLNLANQREAILELTKGKVTTDPAHHSGEGIFFTSRMFDSFSILSDRLYFSHRAPDDDWLIETRSAGGGTFVQMRISTRSATTTREVFDRYTSTQEVPAFDRTSVPVRLLCVAGENAVSRSQAKRLLAGFDRFAEVMLDFEGVTEIGQAFADEVFRVFTSQHPNIRLKWMRANVQVEKMIQRAMNSAQRG